MIIPTKTKHVLSFRLKFSKKKLSKGFQGQIKPKCSVWRSLSYEFNWADHTRAWLPGIDYLTSASNHIILALTNHLLVSKQTVQKQMTLFNRVSIKQNLAQHRWSNSNLHHGAYTHMLFGRHGIMFENYGILTSKFLQTTYMEVNKITKKRRLWLRLSCQTPMTARPAETRMGKGKGAISYWATAIRPGQLWFEFEGLNETKRNQILISLQKKSPYRIKLIGISK
jgi:large subunit ribosomal protein L16